MSLLRAACSLLVTFQSAHTVAISLFTVLEYLFAAKSCVVSVFSWNATWKLTESICSEGEHKRTD